MTKKRTPHSSKRTTKKSKKNKGRDESTPKAVRFGKGEVALIADATKVMAKQFPDENWTVNHFIRTTAVSNAKRTIQFKNNQGKLKLNVAPAHEAK